MTQCSSIRAKTHPEEPCTAKAKPGSEWCGRHASSCVRFVAPPTVTTGAVTTGAAVTTPPVATAAPIFRAWRRWLVRRAGPLAFCRSEANNPFDFFSSDPVEEIPLRDFISFVDTDGKGYVMDVKSAVSLVDHAKTSGETPTNPFNRAPLPTLFLRRLARATKVAGAIGWETLKPKTETEKLSLAATDLFRSMEDLGYYTDPSWILDLTRCQLQQLYIELADIWYHRAGLSGTDRGRIVPLPARAFPLPVTTVLIMQPKALKPLLIEVCRTLVATATARSDKQLGAMYILGALSLVCQATGVGYPWLTDMFSPGVSRIVGSSVQILHPGVLAY
jgi:hypothetical protein